MKEKWPSEESKRNFIAFLEFELRVSECALGNTIDPELLKEFNSFLSGMFPLTNAYIMEKTKEEEAGLSELDIRAFAWAEARSSKGENGKSRVGGSWTRQEIFEDIEECLEIARKSADS